MGAPADVRCYAPPELERELTQIRCAREAVSSGIELRAPAADASPARSAAERDRASGERTSLAR